VALIMGLLGGLGLGMASAFLCEALDEGLTTPSQVASVLRMPVLGSMERICE
jgi:capsular polysaccharide biosynthesis protein